MAGVSPALCVVFSFYLDSQLIRKPSLTALLLLAFGLAFFLTLGFWQLGRAEFKRTLYANFLAGSGAHPATLTGALEKWQPNHYEPVQLRGEFIAGKTVLLDSQTQDGQVGVQVFQGFQSEGKTVLVALGFIAIARDRSQFPTPAVPSGQQRLRGLLANPPASGLKLGEMGEAPQSATWLVNRIEIPALSQFFDAPLIAPVLLLDPNLSTDSLSSSDSVLKLPRHWQPNTFPPERHTGYAVTWFGFALTALIIFYLLHRESS